MKLIITLIVILSLCGCSVDKKTIDKAEELCEPNKGLALIYVDVINDFNVSCNNGAGFYLKSNWFFKGE